MSEALMEFFAMGGYGNYVWSAYAITFAVLLANLLFTRYAHKQMLAGLRRERQIKAATERADKVEPSAAGNGENP